MAVSTIQRGLRELAGEAPLSGDRTRKAGGGRKRAIDLDTTQALVNVVSIRVVAEGEFLWPENFFKDKR